MSIEDLDLFIPQIESLKVQLRGLASDKFTSSYRRINQPEAKYLLAEIESLQRENAELKEKLSKINELSQFLS